MRKRTLAHYPWPARAAMVLDRVVAGVPRDLPDILITGFWRSGTTWLQEVLSGALSAKTIFEPLSPKASGRAIGAPWLSLAPLQEAWMPLAYSALSAKDRAYLDSVFLGCAPGAFSLHCRRSVLESFRARSVIKMVRGAYLVPELIERHKLYALHIRRHPGAVVASFLQCKWSWSFREVRFGDIFPPTHAEPSLREDIERLQHYDDKPDFEKIAAYWAFAEKSIAGFGHERFTLVGYEPLAMAGAQAFTRLVEFVGGPALPRIDAARDSTVTTAERLSISPAERTQSWRSQLDGAMRKRIDQAVRDIWPAAPVRDGEIAHDAIVTRTSDAPAPGIAFAT